MCSRSSFVRTCGRCGRERGTGRVVADGLGHRRLRRGVRGVRRGVRLRAGSFDRAAPAAVGVVAEVKCCHCGGRLVLSSGTGLGQFYIHEINRAVACDWGPTFKGSLYGTNADPVKVAEPAKNRSGGRR
jgi:hypothetical protein